jgi:hypothetical protein
LGQGKAAACLAVREAKLRVESKMDFKGRSYDELDQEIMEQLVFDDGAISPILKGHLFVERVLEELIEQRLAHPAAILRRGRLSFELKADLARALGAISDKHVSVFKALNNVRNNYAHDGNFQVRFEELNGFKLNWAPIQRKAYKKACEKGPEEAARIATIFLCWDALKLVKQSAP